MPNNFTENSECEQEGFIDILGTQFNNKTIKIIEQIIK